MTGLQELAVVAVLTIAGVTYQIWQLRKDEREFDDSQIDELCGHDWNPEDTKEQ